MTAKTAASGIAARDFVHLHNHSHYSLLDGLQKVPEMLDRVNELGMEAVALTDHGSLSGTIEFYKEAKARGIKPVIGIETYIAPRSHHQKDGKQDANPYHLILLAMNNQGYENLMKLSSIAYIDGFYYKPRIDRDLLQEYNKGLIVLSGCVNSEVGDALRNNQLKQARTIIEWYKTVFGDRYYLEVQDHGHMWPVQKKINEALLKLGKEYDLPVVVTADAHYCKKEDQDAHEILLCVQTGSLLDDSSRMSLKDMHLFMSDPDDIVKRWKDNPEVLTNTRKVADRCEVDIEFGKILIPEFKTPINETEQSYLRKLAFQGLARRYTKKSPADCKKLTDAAVKKIVDKDKLDRLEYELETINKMGFAGYFLIVADFINWGKDQGIIIGPGRGSVAGSIVSYALNITDLDPLEHDLMFERFLNPNRISMPDIDIDFQDDRRDEVIDYVTSKYGKDRVAHIVTFGKMAARNAIRDTARVLGVPYLNADRLAKLVPPPVQGRHIPLKTSIEQNLDLKQEYSSNEESKRVINIAMRLEGTIRSHGVHAAGVVIAPAEITKFTPLEIAQKGVVATQYSMLPIEDIGLLKMDFLGLANLTIIKNALRIIKKVYKREINLPEIPMNDPETFNLLCRGDTTGVFQLESAGMKRYLKELKPNQFEDIIAMVSLYRPGPIAELPRYVENKNNPAKISYPHPSLEPILKDTYGVMVYQEQIIHMLQLIAGYTPGEADLVRKAIGKKKRDIMEAEKPRFIEGCLKQGLTNEGAEKLWALIQPFADYSFNKSHAACYALIAYQTAYLKAHYPDAFMAALMTSDFEDNERIAIEIAECKHMGIEVLPPDINESFVEFAVVPGQKAIRFGLAAIKNVGVGAVERILEARQDGLFTSVEDFVKRVKAREVNKKTWESLIKTGVFDRFADRQQLLQNLDRVIAYSARLAKEENNHQADLFGGVLAETSLAPKLDLDPATEAVNDSNKWQWERELLGIYLSKHPLDQFTDLLGQVTTPINSIKQAMDGKSIEVGGLITNIRKITTKNGSAMAFVMLEDLTGSIELIIFPALFQKCQDILNLDNIVYVAGKVSTKDRAGNLGSELKILADNCKVFTKEVIEDLVKPKLKQKKAKPTKAIKPKRLKIVLLEDCDPKTLLVLKNLLLRFKGQDEVIVRIDGQLTDVRLPFLVGLNPSLIDELKSIKDVKAISLI